MIQITKFHSSKDAIYPSLSICIRNPILEDKFEQYGDASINKQTYYNFLDGLNWNEKMLVVDYDNVTVSFDDSYVFSFYKKRISNFGSSKLQNWDFKWKPEYYVSFRSNAKKCFTVVSPYFQDELLEYFNMIISNDIFPNGRCSMCLETYFHYPGQRFYSSFSKKELWRHRSKFEN